MSELCLNCAELRLDCTELCFDCPELCLDCPELCLDCREPDDSELISDEPTLVLPGSTVPADSGNGIPGRNFRWSRYSLYPPAEASFAFTTPSTKRRRFRASGKERPPEEGLPRQMIQIAMLRSRAQAHTGRLMQRLMIYYLLTDYSVCAVSPVSCEAETF